MGVAESTATEVTPRQVFSIRKWAWPVVYCLTIFAFLTWYEIVPRLRAYSYVQGDWQVSRGAGAKEQPIDNFVRFFGGEVRSSYLHQGRWGGAKSRVRFTPARNFYVVEAYLDYGTRTSQTQYVAYLRDGKVYEIRGLVALDPIQDLEAKVLRRVDELPAGAKEALEAQ